jgi:hypothetical protein
MIVTLQDALSAVTRSAHRLREAGVELELIAVEDRPRAGDVHLVDQVQHAAYEIAGAAEMAARAAARGDVLTCQDQVIALGAALVRDLAAPERTAELGALGDRFGGETRAWAGEVLRCAQNCQRALWTDVQPAIQGYWREMSSAPHAGR